MNGRRKSLLVPLEQSNGPESAQAFFVHTKEKKLSLASQVMLF
jgi:hypothetical protein